jgi:3-phosphoshikimate 1-carboxyvinyltransferase
MGKFNFIGNISSSKSLFNRALIVKSFDSEIEIQGENSCDDVQFMIKNVNNFKTTKDFFCGDAGTVLRFWALRLSREFGSFKLKGSNRLFSRPMEDLLFVLEQLGVNCEVTTNELKISGQGWKKPLTPIRLHREKSSQFASAVLLSAWALPFDLDIEFTGIPVSESYLKMTISLLESFGMNIQINDKSCSIKKNQNPNKTKYVVEPDYSSMFAVAASAALSGQAEFKNYNGQSLQPDHDFVSILKKMNIDVKLVSGILKVAKTLVMQPSQIVLKDAPDLFPCLSVLCAFAEGESRLVGAPQLIYKESNRIKKTQELLNLMGIKSDLKDNGLVILGIGRTIKARSFVFDTDQDHRMAMAAGLLVREGWPVTVKGHRCVNKSYPEFWKALGLEK